MREENRSYNEVIDYLNKNYYDGENVPGWEIAPRSFEELVSTYGLEIVKRKDNPHYKGEVWQFVDYIVTNGKEERAFITRTAW